MDAENGLIYTATSMKKNVYGKPTRVIKPALLSAGVVIVRRAEGELRFLILRSFRNWDFPKGLVDPGEEPFAAACREVAEETGLTDLNFRWGQEFRETERYAQGKIARLYLAECAAGEASLPVSAALGRPEHHEFRWVSYATALTLMPARFLPILEWAWARCEADLH